MAAPVRYSGNTSGGLTAERRGFAPSNGKFTDGDLVRLAGEHGPRYRVLGFRSDGSAELFEQSPGTGQRTVNADRVRKAKALRR